MNKLQRNVDRQEQRLSTVYNYMLLGLDNRTITKKVKEEYGVHQKTVMSDMKKLDAEIMKRFEANRDTMLSKEIDRLDRATALLFKVVQEATQQGDKTRALSQIRDNIVAKCKLTGVYSEHVKLDAQVRGVVAHTEVSKEDMAILVDSLDRAGIDKKQARKLIVK